MYNNSGSLDHLEVVLENYRLFLKVSLDYVWGIKR